MQNNLHTIKKWTLKIGKCYFGRSSKCLQIYKCFPGALQITLQNYCGFGYSTVLFLAEVLLYYLRVLKNIVFNTPPYFDRLVGQHLTNVFGG